MTQTELTCADSAMAAPNRHGQTRYAQSADETKNSERRNRRMGVLIILTTAAAFYGGIAACIWKFF